MNASNIKAYIMFNIKNYPAKLQKTKKTIPLYPTDLKV